MIKDCVNALIYITSLLFILIITIDPGFVLFDEEF
jgi:hypothetical protein